MAAFLTVLLILILVAAPITGLCLQTIPLRLDNIRFRATDVSHAWRLVGQYAEGTFEQRFGYPTGYFQADMKRSEQPTRIVLRELQPAGAITDGCAFQITALSLSGFDEGCGAGCLMFAVTATIGAPFLLVTVLDRFFRFLLRSRVEVRLRTEGEDAMADFAFYGPGGYLLRRRYAHVFHTPELPDGLGLAVAATVPAVANSGRHRA